MTLSNKGGDRAPSGYLLSPNETSSSGIGLHSIELAKGAQWKSSLTQAVAKTTVARHKLMARPFADYDICAVHWLWRSQAGAYIEPSPLPSRIFGTRGYSGYCQKRDRNTHPITNPSICSGDLPARWARPMVAQNLWEKPTVILGKTKHDLRFPYFTLLGWQEPEIR